MIGARLILSPAGHDVAPDVFARGQSELPELEVIMALQYVETRQGASRIYTAECEGRRRPAVIAAAARRLDDFDQPRRIRGEAQS